MSFIPEYQSYIQKITDLYLGEQLLDWRSEYHLEMMENIGSFHLAIELTPEEIRNAIRARLIVVEEIQQGAYQHIFYVEGDEIHKTDTEISADYHGEALYMVSAEGEILAGPISWYPVDGGICIYGIAEYAIDWDNFDWTQPIENLKIQDAVRLVYQKDEKGGFTFSGLIILSDAQEGMNLPSSASLDSFSNLEIINSWMTSITSLDHLVLDDSISFQAPVTNEAPRLAVLPVFSSNDRYAYLRITDTQGNTICSETCKIDNPTRISIAQEQMCAEESNIRVMLKSADLITGIQAGVKCTFAVRNGSDLSIRLSVQQAALENKPLLQPKWYRIELAPGEEDEFIVFIDGNAIRDSGLQEANSLTVTLGLQAENGYTESIDAAVAFQLNTAIFSAFDYGADYGIDFDE